MYKREDKYCDDVTENLKDKVTEILSEIGEALAGLGHQG